MLEAKKLQLETEESPSATRNLVAAFGSFGTQDYDQAAKELLQKTGDLHTKTTTKYF